MLVKIAVDIAIKMWMDYLDYKLKYIHLLILVCNIIKICFIVIPSNVQLHVLFYC